MREGRPFGRPFFALAAAAVVVAAATVVLIVTAVQAVVAAATEQDEQDDDPAHITAAETVITHNKYLQIFHGDFRRSFQGIHKDKFCAAKNHLISQSLT